MASNASAPGEIWTVGAFTMSKGETMTTDDQHTEAGARLLGNPELAQARRDTPRWDDDTTARCTWATLTCLDSAGTVRVIEIPVGNQISVTVEETRPDRYAVGVEADLMDIPPQSLSALFDRGVKVTIEARRGSLSDGGLLRVYGCP